MALSVCQLLVAGGRRGKWFGCAVECVCVRVNLELPLYICTLPSNSES
jgi:hypothetical protein